MSRLDREPKVVKLARDLGIGARVNFVRGIQDFAMGRVAELTSGFTIESFDALRLVIANRLRMAIHILVDDSDLDRISSQYGAFHPVLRRRLEEEFVRGDTEGITLELENPSPGSHRFLAVIDGRGTRAIRAYFTAWHEVVHILVHPEQLTFPGFRRSPTDVVKRKDPIESLVDAVAAKVSFYEPLFRPAVERHLTGRAFLSFEHIDAIRLEVVPSASTFATAMACLEYDENPTALVRVEPGFKKSEARVELSGQQSFSFRTPPAQPLRAITFVPNVAARSVFAIRPNMRVPAQSVLARAYTSEEDFSICEREDQEQWETSASGFLAALPLHVQAIKRSGYVYGLITAARND